MGGELVVAPLLAFAAGSALTLRQPEQVVLFLGCDLAAVQALAVPVLPRAWLCLGGGEAQQTLPLDHNAGGKDEGRSNSSCPLNGDAFSCDDDGLSH